MLSQTEQQSVKVVYFNYTFYLKKLRGTWVAQSVEHLTLVQVMISQFVGSSPALDSVLTAQSLEPASDSVSPLLSTLPPPPPALSLSHKNKYTLKKTEII